MLFWVWVGACVPPVWVMVVGEGCSGWCCFQYCVAVVWASRRVPGVGVCVSWLVSGVCLGVGWLVVGACGVCACVVGASVGVVWLVCVLWWFRMLTCSGLFLVFLVLFVLLITACVPGGGVLWRKEWLVLVWGVFACVCSRARESGMVGGVGLCG